MRESSYQLLLSTTLNNLFSFSYIHNGIITESGKPACAFSSPDFNPVCISLRVALSPNVESVRADVTATTPDVTTTQMFVLCKISSTTISSLSKATCATVNSSQLY